MSFADLKYYEDLYGAVPAALQGRVEANLRKATAQIQTMTRQTLTLGTSTVQLAGTWGLELLLPERPVVAVDYVEILGREITGFSTTTRSIRWERSQTGPTPPSARAGFPANWGGPDVLVTVTYLHGFDPIPDDLKELCAELAAVKMRQQPGLRSESRSLGSFQAQAAYDMKGEGTGPMLSSVIRKYSV